MSEDKRTRELVREGVTMALYLSLSLLAVAVAVPTGNVEGNPLGSVVLTGIGLLIAHLLAFSVSSRLVSEGRLDAESREIAGVQVVAGVLVIACAALPLLLLEPPASLVVARVVLLGIVMAVGYSAARQSHASRTRALVYVFVVLFAAVGVLFVKSLAGH